MSGDSMSVNLCTRSGCAETRKRLAESEARAAELERMDGPKAMMEAGNKLVEQQKQIAELTAALESHAKRAEAAHNVIAERLQAKLAAAEIGNKALGEAYDYAVRMCERLANKVGYFIGRTNSKQQSLQYAHDLLAEYEAWKAQK